MKPISSIKTIAVLACCLVLASSGYPQDLKTLWNEQLKTGPKSDRIQAETQALAELGLKSVPEKVPDGKELSDLISREAERLSALKFTAEMKARIQQEAKTKFKVIQEGDEITVQVRQGASFVDYKGKYKGTTRDKVLVGERQILKSDLQPDILEKLDAGKTSMAQDSYVASNFNVPRKKYATEIAEKLTKEYAGKKKTYENFIAAVDSKEKAFKEKAADLAIGKYLELKQTDIDKLPGGKDKLTAYNNLMAEISNFLNNEGLSKNLENYVSLKPVIADKIPALEKAGNEASEPGGQLADVKPPPEKKSQEGQVLKAESAKIKGEIEDRISDLRQAVGDQFTFEVLSALSFDDFPEDFKEIDSVPSVGIYNISIGNSLALLVTRESTFRTTGMAMRYLFHYANIPVVLGNGATVRRAVYVEALGDDVRELKSTLKEKKQVIANDIMNIKDMFTKYLVKEDDAEFKPGKEMTRVQKEDAQKRFNEALWNRAMPYDDNTRFVFIDRSGKYVVNDVGKYMKTEHYVVKLSDVAKKSGRYASCFFSSSSSSPIPKMSKSQDVGDIKLYAVKKIEKFDNGNMRVSNSTDYLFPSQGDFCEYLKVKP